MNVLSLFDGMSCGQIALERAGIAVKNYYASEVDKWAIKVAQHNYPKTIHLGSVLGLWERMDKNGCLYVSMSNDCKKTEHNLPVSIEENIDLIMGGSPCQGFSFAGKGLNFEDHRSKLFFEFVRILNIIKKRNPNVKFLLENVIMKKEFQNIISNMLGVEPVKINSNLLSAQNRNRLYWTNILNVSQPEDRKIFLKDILENGVTDRDKSFCIDANYFKGTNIRQYLLKSRRQIVFTETRTEEAKKIRREHMKKGIDFSPRRAKELVPRNDDKCNCLTTSLTKEHILLDESSAFRKLTPVECERLQTVPDNYTSIVSNSQRYKMLGNGWTVDVIAHIFKQIKTTNTPTP